VVLVRREDAVNKWLVVLGGTVMGLIGCEAEKSALDTGDDERIEGEVDGDCSDGLDNDGDAFFDCLDVSCEGSPECSEDDPAIILGDEETGYEETGDYDVGVTDDEESIEVDSVGWNCDEDAYWFEVYVAGQSTGGWLYMYQTGTSSPWNEDHPIDVHESAPDWNWTRLYLSLDSVYPDVTAVVSGSTTLYDCSDGSEMPSTITFIIEIDAVSQIAVECVVWGDSPNDAPADDCARITPDLVSQLR